MSKKKGQKPGQVVWVPNVPDRHGIAKSQPRPLLVIHPGPIDRHFPLCCLGISTDPKDDPADPAIEMPWDATDGSTTGLFAWCRVEVPGANGQGEEREHLRTGIPNR